MIAQHLHDLNLILNLDSDYNGKCAQKQNILKKALSDGPSANLSPLLNSNMTKVSVIKQVSLTFLAWPKTPLLIVLDQF